MRPTTGQIYDPARALAIAGGRPELRDATLLGLLELLEDARGPLGNVAHYAGDPATVYEVAHRAVGLARQAAMPALETLLRALADALEAGALEEAQRLGQCLPAALAAVRRVLAGGGPPE
jgi:hypothetical protein